MIKSKETRYAVAITAMVVFVTSPLIYRMADEVLYRVRQGIRTYDHYDYEAMTICAEETYDPECCFANVIGGEQMALYDMAYNCSMVIPYR